MENQSICWTGRTFSIWSGRSRTGDRTARTENQNRDRHQLLPNVPDAARKWFYEPPDAATRLAASSGVARATHRARVPSQRDLASTSLLQELIQFRSKVGEEGQAWRVIGKKEDSLNPVQVVEDLHRVKPGELSHNLSK